MKSLALVVDEAYCWGCKACEVACKQENGTPVGIKLISVLEDGPKEINGTPVFQFGVRFCRHCEEPPCAAACPVDAITRRADGIVVLEETECTGCKACMKECPYDAIAFDEKRGVAQKCNLCHHRVDQGLVPACADNICLGYCIHFGDPEALSKRRSGIRKQ